MIYTASYSSPFGDMLLAQKDGALVGLWFEGQKYYGAAISESVPKDDDKTSVKVKRWLDRYFSGQKPDAAELALAPAGSDFRQAVWAVLREIPYGKTLSYGDIARTLAKRKGLARVSARAVGGAVAHNPVSVIIPCHRGVGSDGKLTGYAGGIDKKIKLLELEGIDITMFKDARRASKGAV